MKPEKNNTGYDFLSTVLFHVSASVQIIGMSATLSNTNELSTFLKGSVYRNNFRPVKLDEYVKMNDSVYRLNSEADEKLVKERNLLFSVCLLVVCQSIIVQLLLYFRKS